MDEPVPNSYQEVTSLGSEPELAGTIRFIIGRRVLLDTASGPLLADMCRFAGWTIAASAARTADGLGHRDPHPAGRPLLPARHPLLTATTGRPP